MTDLSLPLHPPKPDDTAGGGVGADWPGPPYAVYALARLVLPEDCTIEGPRGKSIAGQLLQFDPSTGGIKIRVGHGRVAVPIAFEQVHQITLTRPLRPDIDTDGDPALAQLERPAPIEYRLTTTDGQQRSGMTFGRVETVDGLFLFPPAGESGAVRRVFVPRRHVREASFGKRIGEILVEQHKLSAQQVEAVVAEQQRLRSQRLGEALVSQQIVTPEQLVAAIEHQARMPMMRIGEALVGLGLIDEQQLADALEQQKLDRSVPLGELLVRQGLVSRQDLQTALARKMGYPVVDVAAFPAEAEAVQRVPFAVARRLNVLPLIRRSTRLVVAMDDPTVRASIEELEFVSQCKAVPALAPAAQIARTLAAVYEKFGAADVRRADGGADPEPQDASQLLASLELQSSTASDDDNPIEQSDNSLVRMVNTMIADACTQKVSDIHIETQPGREKVRIRFRRDGVLRPYLELPHTYRSALVARIKIMCDLDIAERRKPQDGKINFARFSPQHKVELRVATIPTHGGLEDVVMRILASARPLPIDALALSASNLERLRQAVHRPYGMVLCVGPTGSGKTTTLHSLLGDINKPDRKIWTAEDPIEITQPGLRQVQVNPKIDWTFAKALRAFLRADPDVIMVGEIRDHETAQVAIEASLTGHLVLTTLHTNSAPETVTRLLDMGMDPFNFGDSLLAVLAQRLVRRLCAHCRTARDATDAEVEDLLGDHLHAFPDEIRPSRDDVLADWTKRHASNGRLQHHHAPGCARCDHTGFDGRVGLHELLTVNRPLRRLIVTGGRVEQLQHQAIADGMRTLRQDGIDKVLQGLTTIGEVRAMSNV
jgi:type II secretory ATPase GspE/PulE/Tfp pilus assembly ATPase PilB-like protein